MACYSCKLYFNNPLSTGCYLSSVNIWQSTERNIFLIIIMLYCMSIHFPCPNFQMHCCNWIKINCLSSKCCTCFKKSNLFRRYKQGFLWNTKTYMEDIWMCFSLSIKGFIQMDIIHSFLSGLCLSCIRS